MTAAADRRARILDAIGAACAKARRDPSEVDLIAVSKGRGLAEIEALIAAGQRDFGESRVQEARDKWPALLGRYRDVRLHFIGRLQSNKVEEAAALFDAIHSIDRSSLVAPLARADRRPDLYVQVNIGEEERKGGCAIGDLPALVSEVRPAGLPLVGLMGIPPLGVEPSPYFALLAKLARREGVAGLSMGMSNDFASAVTLGATAVRVGTALFVDP